MEKTYAGLIALESFNERLEYLRLYSDSPANKNRNLMNKFYKSKEWKRVRDYVIKRDLCCDLGVQNEFINGTVLIHHINPISEKDLEEFSPKLLDPNNLICVSYDTHNKIHYLNEETCSEFVERKPGDTILW